MSRKLWTDGWNSFWHFTFGALAYKIPVIIFMFLIYQAFANEGLYERNVTTDILEFFIGLISMIAAAYTAEHYVEIPHELFTEIIPDIVMAL
jgi:F0F1-type ATP synthase assembly protein I